MSALSPTVTWSHTVGSGNDRILVVGLSCGLGGATSVTYGSQSLLSGGGGIPISEIWTLVAPATGTATVTASFAAVQDVVGGSVSFSGVDQTTTIRGFNSGSGSGTGAVAVSTSVTTATGDVVIDNVAAFGASAARTPEAGQTLQWNGGPGGPAVSGSGSTKPGAAGSTGMSWNLSSLNPAATVAASLVTISLIPAVPSSTPTATATATPTATPTVTPTASLIPQGGACATPSQCGTGFCANGVCCDSACTDPLMRCNLPGQVGTCASAAAAAPALTPWGLLAAAALLTSIAGVALR